MDRDKAIKVLGLYGNPSFKVGNTNCSFARQSLRDVDEIEKLSDNELIGEFKSLVFMNDIYGSVSLNEMQRLDLMEIEIVERDILTKDEFDEWYNKAKKEWEIEEKLQIKEYEDSKK